MPGQLAGIDLGGTKIQGVVVDQEGRPLARAVASTPTSGGPRSVVEQVAAVAREVAANAGVAIDELDGVGVGSPGRVEMAAGIAADAGNLSGFDRPVPLAHRLGAGRGLDDLLAVFAGTGVGGALVLDGRLRRGFRSAAGEIGHAVVVAGGEECPCGRRGCTEAYVGRAPMERAVRAAAAAGRATALPAIQQRLGRARLTTDVLAEGLALGDALAAELVERAARALGTAIASASNLLDVQGVLLGGGLTDGLGEPFVRRVEAETAPHLFADEPPLEIRVTALGDLAGAVGAALLVHETPSSP